MANEFKIFKGTQAELDQIPLHEGYAYFTDEGNFYIDNATKRVQSNAKAADYLKNSNGKLLSLQEILNKISKSNSAVSYQNILINSDFRKPVNKNGERVYSMEGETIDRWFILIDEGIEFSIEKDFIRIKNISELLKQVILYYLPLGTINTEDQTFCCSIMHSFNANKNIYLELMNEVEDEESSVFQFVFSNNNDFYDFHVNDNWNISKVINKISYNISRFDFSFELESNEYIDIKAIKFEYNSDQTLAYFKESTFESENQEDSAEVDTSIEELILEEEIESGEIINEEETNVNIEVEIIDGNWQLIDPINYELQYALCNQFNSEAEWVGNPNMTDFNEVKNIAENALPKSGGIMTSSIELPTYALHGQSGTKEVFFDFANNVPYIGFHENYDSGAPIIINGVAKPIRNNDAANKLYVDSSIIHPNMLINAYWAQKSHVINQRGQNSYTNAGYGIDKWHVANGTLSITDSSLEIIITNQYTAFKYPIEPLPPGIYTVTFLTDCTSSSGIYMEAGSKYLTNFFDNGLISAAFTITDTSNIDNVRLTSSTSEPVSFHAYAAKLEPGRYQTLAHKEGDAWILNEIPDYTTELLKCQRYLYVANSSGKQYYALCSASAISENEYIFDSPIKNMRSKPSILLNGTWNVDRPGVQSFMVSSLNSDWIGNDGSGNFTAAITGSNTSLISGKLSTSTGGKIIFSSEL